jgi:maltooligosyltrehalose trehalohydrolase
LPGCQVADSRGNSATWQLGNRHFGNLIAPSAVIVSPERRRPIGAEVLGEGVDFRVWAPDHHDVAVVIGDGDIALDSEGNGYFRGIVRDARAGTRYRFRLDRERESFPDPASRFQLLGPHGPSVVVDPGRYQWRERNPQIDDRVIYEMHIGTFTREGTWAAATRQLAPIAELGINTLEIMPVHEFPGRFGWGYDGVDLWAPTRLYGSPDDFRDFVDAAHALSLAVILDVVYNHLGPDGCYLGKFTRNYFTDRYKNEWGEAINFDGPGSEGVREFFSQNAAYWIDEFNLDGLRLDATQSIIDNSQRHVISLITQCAREAAHGRDIFIVAENEPQDIAVIRDYGVDAMWNDDWHHAAMIAAGRTREAYYTDYKGSAQEFVSMARHGFLYQGQRYAWQKNRRGTPSLDTPPRQLVCYLQNHDQVANSATGERLHQTTSPGIHRALTALLLLGANTPMLFQGQEFSASSPFLYFADHNEELAKAVSNGRADFMTQFPSVNTKALALPNALSTFERSKLDHSEREKNRDAIDLHRELLKLRKEPKNVDGAVLGENAFVLRFDDDRLLLVNLGPQLDLDIAPEPLLAPPSGARWRVEWSSDGSEQVEFDDDPGWRIPGEAAVLLSVVYTRT